MTTPTPTRPTPLCDRCRLPIAADSTDDLGFGYFRDADTEPTPVPDGVELILLTGRTPRGTR
jgi:hypothetical protein